MKNHSRFDRLLTRFIPSAGMAFAALLSGALVHGDCIPGEWDPAFGDPGANLSVRAMAQMEWMGGTQLVAAGAFTSINGTPANRIAQWNGASWQGVGGGFASGTVFALTSTAPENGEIIAAGSIPGSVLSWNGSSWFALGGGLPTIVYALATADVGDGQQLIAGGSFTTGNRIAAYDRSNDQWNAIGTGFANGAVRALAVYGSGAARSLYAAGTFTEAGGSPGDRIARWNGSAWVPVGGGFSGAVYALAVFDDGTGPHLYAAGSFTSAGGTPANRIARWDGNNWEEVAGGFPSGTIWSLHVHDDGSGPALYAGGSQPGRVSRWTGVPGSSWENIGQTSSGTVYTLQEWGSNRADLFVGGISMTSMGGETAINLARRSGCAPAYRNPPHIDARITASSTPGFTGILIASDADNPDPNYNRDSIRVEVTGVFERTFGNSASGHYRVAFQLLDAAGNPIPVHGGSGPGHRVLSPWRSVFLGFSTPSATEAFAANLRPAVELPAFSQVRLRATLIERRVPINSALPEGERIRDWWRSSAAPTLHFASTDPDDDELNVRNFLGGLTLQRSHIIDTADGDDTFRARVVWTSYRYDQWDASSNGPDPVDFHFDISLRDSDGNSVALEESRFTVTRNIRRWAAGTPRQPATTTEEAFLHFRPAGQIDSTKTYDLTVAMSHTENPLAPPGTGELAGMERSRTGDQLLHFNGDLFFDDIRFVITDVDSSPAMTGPGGINSIEVSLDIAESGAYLASKPDHSLGAGAPLTARLFNDGRAVVMDGSRSVRPTSLDPFDAIGEVHGIRFYRAQVVANAGGVEMPMTLLLLPAGFGLRAEASTVKQRAIPYVFLSGGSLDENLLPDFDPSATYSLSNRAILTDDARPLAYRATAVTWNTSGGFIELGGTDVIYLNEERYALMEQWVAEGYLAPEEARRRSNEGHYRHVSALGSPVRIYGKDGGLGGVDTELMYGPGAYEPHFPLTGDVQWTGGRMVLDEGEVRTDGAQSFLENVTPIQFAYRQDCPEVNCGDGDGMKKFAFDPAGGRMWFTGDGGLHAQGVLIGHNDLQWGATGGGNFAYNVAAATQGSLHIAGHQARHTESPRPALEKPAALLYAGVDPSALDNYERLGQQAYLEGHGDYPGVNFRVPSDAPGMAVSRIGGTAASFVLTNRSKFYVREAGVTGIYEEEPGTFGAPNGELTLYGYDFVFDRYGLNFVFGDNRVSLTDGSVSVPFPSAFTHAFEGLTFTCLGAPDTAAPPEGEDDLLPLAYWQAAFQTRAIDFAQNPAALCGDAPAFLTLGMSARFGALDVTAHGVVGFLSTGEILSWGRAVEENLGGLTSRLALPPSVTLAGPEAETYHLNPVSDLYFNDYAAHSGDGAVGFITFATTTAVPFFRDLELQVITSAQPDVENAAIHLAGGWPSAGWRDGDLHFFTSSTFDRAHRGFPQGVALTDYRAGNEESPDAYLVRAVQSWLDIVEFDYPLLWSNTLRTFRSKEELEEDLIVVEVNHRVERMSPRNVELIFGASYDGLPQVNLAAVAVFAIDDATGAASALVEAVGDHGRGIIDSLGGGIDSAADLLRDRMDLLFGPMLDNALNAVIDPAYNALEEGFDTLQAGANTIDDFQNEWATERLNILNEFLTGTVGTAEATLVGALTQLDGLVADADGLLGQVDQRLARIQLFIAAIIDEVQLDIDGIPMPNFNPNHEALIREAMDALPLPGILAEIEGERQIIRNFAELLVQQLSPEIAGAMGILDEILGELEQRLEALLERAEPTIDRVVAVLERADQEVQGIRDLLDHGSAYANEVRGMFANAQSEIETLATEVRDAIDGFFQEIEDNRPSFPAGEFVADLRSPFDQFDPEEIKERIRQEVRDRFYQTAVIDDVQQFLKAKLYEVDAIIQDAVDTALHTINHTIRDFMADAVAELDDTINGIIGPLGDFIGTGDIAGYAHIQGEAIRLLRLDGAFEWQVPKPLTFRGYLQIRQFDADGPATACGPVGDPFNEVEIGALDVPLDWISDGMRADVMTRFAFSTGPFQPTGLAGSFELTGGGLNFEAFRITALGAAVAFGSTENYLSAMTELEFSDYRLAGGVFFGRTCTLDPIALWDPEVADLLGTPNPTFTGAYVYGEGWIPISEALLGIPASCMFRISAGVGAGAFYFVEGPTYGGRLMAGISGEALCLVSIQGEARLVGVKQGDDFRFSGSGGVAGRAGKCPVCVKFSKTVNLSYINGNWNIDL